MIGLGKWKFPVDTMLYRGDAVVDVADDGGTYAITIALSGMDVPDITVSDVRENENTVTGTAQIEVLKGKDIPFSITFEGDCANGFLKVPFMGKIKLNKGVRIG
ncbi:MAG: hypothetical protein LBB67_01890 [Oscillospiraceae bacterium]|jgi:hypothetical protein|nr:hypothetical protein [Oscillospiraceae bacterium]